jgi:hypothetical protein
MPAIDQSLCRIQVCVFRNCVIKNATQETQFAYQDMPDLQPPVFLAEEVGEGLGSGQVLLRRVQRQAKSNTMKHGNSPPLLGALSVQLQR